jgi:hypothetical protein
LQAGPQRISGLGVISNFSIRRSRILKKLEIDLSQIFFGGRPATPDTSIIRVYNQAITTGCATVA